MEKTFINNYKTKDGGKEETNGKKHKRAKQQGKSTTTKMYIKRERAEEKIH